MNLPRKTTILIVVLAIVTALLIFLAVTNETTQQILITDEPQQAIPSETVIEPYATLNFSTPVLNVANSPTATQSVDIILDTVGKGVFGAQIELQYDPSLLLNMSVNPTPFSIFNTGATILINEVNQTQGRISYAVVLNPNEQEINGKGPIATLTFTPNRANAIPRTEISFLPKSAVTTIAGSGSILKTTTPLSIILNNITPTSSPSAQ